MASMGYSKERIEGMVNFIKNMSQYFKSEAKKYNFPYYEIEDNGFEAAIILSELENLWK